MTSSNESSLDRVKRIFKRIPGVYGLIQLRNNIKRIRELSVLLKEGRSVVLHPYANMRSNAAVSDDIVTEIVTDLLHDYGTIRLRGTTVSSLQIPEGYILLYAPLGLLRIPASYEQYLLQVGTKTRNMIRKAEKHGYEFKEFIWDEHLDEIFEINTSKEVRQSEPMRGWYRDPVQPRHHSQEERQFLKYFGAFKDSHLYAYVHIVLCGDFAFFRHFIGHAQHLTFGVMNGLISYTVQKYIGESQIQWLKYGELAQTSSSMHDFRKHAGFQAYATLLDLEDNTELIKYSAKKARTKWRL